MGRKPKYKEETTTIAMRVPISKKDEISKKFETILKKYQVKPLLTNKSN